LKRSLADFDLLNQLPHSQISAVINANLLRPDLSDAVKAKLRELTDIGVDAKEVPKLSTAHARPGDLTFDLHKPGPVTKFPGWHGASTTFGNISAGELRDAYLVVSDILPYHVFGNASPK
jgi:hypothetical protein